MIELDDWIFAVSFDEHEEMVGSFNLASDVGQCAVSVCPFGYTLQTASGAQMEHAVQKTVEYENSDGGLVNVNFEVADMSRPLVTVGELQKRGMTVVMGPHGSFVTRGQVMKLPSSNLDLEHSNDVYSMRLTRGENGTRTIAPVDLGDAVPTSKDLSELPSVEDTIDVAREEKKRTCCRAIKE